MHRVQVTARMTAWTTAESEGGQVVRDATGESVGAPRGRLSLAARVGVAAGSGMITAALLTIVALLTIATSTSAGGDVRRLDDARIQNAPVISSFESLQRGTSASEVRQGLVASVGAAAARVDDLIRGMVPDVTRAQVLESDRAYLLSITDDQPRGEDGLVETAVTVRRSLADQMDSLRRQRADDLGHSRVVGISLALVVLVIGAVATLLLTRSAVSAVGNSMRSIGRSMRRFGDGDLDSRAPTGDDEIGLVGRSFNHVADKIAGDIRFLRERSERGEQLRVVSDALDLADDLDGIFRVTQHSMSILATGVPMELMTVSSTGRLVTEAVNPSADPPGCPVVDVNGCVALRRGQTSIFPSSEDLNSCPHLRNRPGGACSAVCIPVNFGGELLGVMHSTGPDRDPLPPEEVARVSTMVNVVGARLGAVRQLESTRLEASTDGLTGVANRRMLEASLWRLLREGQSFVLVVADIDWFKRLNDKFGHEVGDRALQLFARVLEQNVRDHDIVARYGGEEFVLVYPELSVKTSLEVMDRIRQAVERAQVDAEHDPFTVSFGVTHSSVAATPDQIIRVADAGLLRAKELGRNRVIFADIDLATEVFGPNGLVTDPVPDVRSDRDAPALDLTLKALPPSPPALPESPPVVTPRAPAPGTPSGTSPRPPEARPMPPPLPPPGPPPLPHHLRGRARTSPAPRPDRESTDDLPIEPTSAPTVLPGPPPPRRR